MYAYLVFLFSQCCAKVLDYRALGLSICTLYMQWRLSDLMNWGCVFPIIVRWILFELRLLILPFYLRLLGANFGKNIKKKPSISQYSSRNLKRVGWGL